MSEIIISWTGGFIGGALFGCWVANEFRDRILEKRQEEKIANHLQHLTRTVENTRRKGAEDAPAANPAPSTPGDAQSPPDSKT